MRIGLARHFLVPHRKSAALDSDGFASWIAWYDDIANEATVEREPGHPWDLCYCSDLRRAHVTATTIHTGHVETTPQLREVPFGPAFRSKAPLPLYLWQALARVGWYVGHRAQPEGRIETVTRVKKFLDMICTTHADKNVLIVSHGFLMQLLARDLRRRGFRGRVPLRPSGGATYVFER